MFPSKSDPINTRLDYLKSNVPVGTIMDNASLIKAPTNWKKCDGSLLLKSEYSDLYDKIGDQYNASSMFIDGTPWNDQRLFNTLYSGTLAPFTTTTSFPTTIESAAVFATKSRVYVAGGLAPTITNVTYTAPINADGTLGAWTNANNNLPSNLYNAMVFTTSSRVYVVGGYNGSSYVSSVYTAPINADGTIGAWETGTAFPISLNSAMVTSTKNTIYIMGGYNSGGTLSSVYKATVNQDGTIGAWTSTTSIPELLCYTSAINTGTRVYLIGGYNNTAYISTVRSAPINADGTLGTWVTETAFPIAFGSFGSLVVNGFAYIIGGYIQGGTYLSTIRRAPINADGTLGSWTICGDLNVARSALSIIGTTTKLYALNGVNGYNSTIQVCDFSGGTLDFTSKANSGNSDPLYFGIPFITSPNTSPSLTAKFIKVK